MTNTTLISFKMEILLFYYGFAMKNLKGGDNILQMHKLAIWNDINASKIQNSMYNPVSYTHLAACFWSSSSNPFAFVQ